MAQITMQHGHETWTIVSPDGALEMSFVPELGGMGVSMVFQTQKGPREMLWLHEKFWQLPVDERYGGWPFLFPICARQARDGIPGVYRYRGEYYRQPIHGFASRMSWQVESSDDQHICMRLTDTLETRKNYPFEFEILLDHRMENGRLICEQTYSNRGDKALPYFAGFHPYFATLPPGMGKECSTIEFCPDVRYLYNEAMTDVVGTGAALSFPASITDPCINEQLHRFAPGQRNHSTLCLEDGLTLCIEAYGRDGEDMFPFLQLFTQKQYPFFCVEPWMGAPNGLNTIDGCRWLQPGKNEGAVFCVAFATE